MFAYTPLSCPGTSGASLPKGIVEHNLKTAYCCKLSYPDQGPRNARNKIASIRETFVLPRLFVLMPLLFLQKPSQYQANKTNWIQRSNLNTSSEDDVCGSPRTKRILKLISNWNCGKNNEFGPPETRPFAPRGKACLPTKNCFQMLYVLVSGRVV